LRLAGCFWALDTALARQRHFPAVNWLRSFSQYDLGPWFDREVDNDWTRLRRWASATLQAEGALQDVASLLGVEALAAEQQLTLRVGRALREDVLQQSSFDPLDASCPPTRLLAMLRVVEAAETAMAAAHARGLPIAEITDASALAALGRMRRWPGADAQDSALEMTAELSTQITEEMGRL